MYLCVSGCVVQPCGEVCRHREGTAAAQDPADEWQCQHTQPFHIQPPRTVRGIHTGEQAWHN